MERELCYCKLCSKFIIIDPDRSCPMCGTSLVSAGISESEWKRSSKEEKTVYKSILTSKNEKRERSQDHKVFEKEKNQKSKQQSKWGSRIATLLVILIMGYLGFSSFFSHNGACSDYESAGKKVHKQITQYDSEVFVSYNSDHYNPIIGINKDVRAILKEACKCNGNPQEGDHLAANMYLTEEKWVAVKQWDDSTNLNMTLTVRYNTNEDQERELKNKADAILASLNLGQASDYEKAKSIYDYICSNVVYDYEHIDDADYRLQGTAYAAAVEGTAVCAGIADLFYYLATSTGLDARITWNDVHAWNYVQIDGQYYYLDTTWDLGKNENDYQYFLKGSRDFVDILNQAEYEAHRPSIKSFLSSTYAHPLNQTDKDYVFSEYSYGT